MAEGCARRDWASRKIGWLLWGVPMVLLVLGIFWAPARVWLWTPALLTAGIACLVNATRCGRLHCYFTRPLYLLGAAYVVLGEFALVSMDDFWFLLLVMGASCLAQLAEVPLGKYIKKPQ